MSSSRDHAHTATTALDERSISAALIYKVRDFLWGDDRPDGPALAVELDEAAFAASSAKPTRRESSRDEQNLRLASQDVGRGWQPIETAPKDGRQFLVWIADNPRHPCDVTVWAHRNGSREGAPLHHELSRVTHWQPVPAPPPPDQPQGEGGER